MPVLTRIAADADETTARRRRLHRRPEPKFDWHGTASVVRRGGAGVVVLGGVLGRLRIAAVRANDAPEAPICTCFARPIERALPLDRA